MALPWYVITPECSRVDVVVAGQGPLEYWHDVVEVMAPTRREAIRKGVREMLADSARFTWVHDQRGDGMCPYTGVRAEAAVCAHGRPHFDMDTEGRIEWLRCQSCEELDEAAAAAREEA